MTGGGAVVSAGAHPLASLHRTVGNQAVLRRLSIARPAIQTKLTINQPGDQYEQEADRAADHVMHMPKPQTTAAVSNRSSSLPRAGGMSADGKSDAEPARVQRNAASTSSANGIEAPPIVHDVLHSPGRPLDEATRAFMEPRFGQDFGHVRVHTDARAERAARLIDAEAYTVGNDIAFAAGRFDLASQAGRGLLAHELAHTIQQSGTPHSRSGDTVSRPADPVHQAARSVLADRPAPQLTSAAPVVARRPSSPARRGFSIQVVVNEPVDGHEFCIRAIMQGHEIERSEAQRLLDSGTLHCYGWASTRGVSQDWVGHPIRFWVDASLGTGAGDARSGNGADVKLAPGEKEEINAEADQRFWKRIGDFRMLSKDDPRDAAYREVWKSERDVAQRERHPAVTGLGSDGDYDPYSSDLRAFAALSGMPVAGDTQEVDPDQMAWMLQVQDMLAGLTKRDWVRLRRVGLPQTGWEGLAVWLRQFIAQQRADDRAIAKVSALDQFGGLDSAYEAVHGMGYGSMDPVEAEAYGHSAELDQAAGEFRASFRARAVEIAAEMLRRAGNAMQIERSRMQSRKEREALYAALANPTIPEAVLDDHPILRDPDTLRDAHNSRTANDLGEWLRGRAYQEAGRIKFLAEHLQEKPDVVFALDVVVAATLDELGLERSVHALILQNGWGASDGSSLFDLLLDIGLSVLMFVPVIGPVIGMVQGFKGFHEAWAEHGADQKAFAQGLRTTEPSLTGVVLGSVGLGLGALPFAHELSTTARSFGQFERLAATDASVAGRAGTDIAAGRAGEDVTASPAGVAGRTSRSAELHARGPFFFKKPAANTNELLPPEGQAAEQQLSATGTSDVAPAQAIDTPGSQGGPQTTQGAGDMRMGQKPQNSNVNGGAGQKPSVSIAGAGSAPRISAPGFASSAQRARLESAIEKAEGLGGGQLLNLDELNKELENIASPAELETTIREIEESVERRQVIAETATVGGGSRPGDPATLLPEGTQTLGRATRYPKEVSAFLQRFPKVVASPESEAVLDALFAGTKSGALGISPWPGRFLPIRTRSAAAELESIVELSGRPEVDRIQLIPSSREGRTVDKIVDIRQLDGSVVATRWEDTTITGAPRGYQLRGAGGRGMADVDRIEAAVRGKVASTPAWPSQFDALMVEAPRGGTLMVHIPRPGLGGAQDVANAMADLEPKLRNTTVQAVEFFLPGEQKFRHQVLRYVRQSDGRFTLATDQAIAP